MARTVRYLKSEQALVRVGDDRANSENLIGIHRNLGGFFESLDHLAPVSLASLRSALSAAAADDEFRFPTTDRYIDLDAVATLNVSPVPFPYVDTKHSATTGVGFDLRSDGALVVTVHFETLREDMSFDRVEGLLAPVLASSGATLVAAEGFNDGPWAGNPCLWGVQIAPRLRGNTIGVAHQLGLAAEALLDMSDSGRLTASQLFALLQRGFVDAVVGRSEDAALEVKSMPYNLSHAAAKIELAQDVARFGNGDSDGLIVVGLGEKSVDGTKRIVKGPGLTWRPSDPSRYHQTIDGRVHPPLENLQIELVADGHGRQLLAILVPRQPRHLKPFLVHGAVVGGSVEGTFISIVRRRGEHSIPTTPAAIHAALAAGLALLGRDNNAHETHTSA